MQREKLLRAFRVAFPYTVPILAGFLFVGIAYGIFMRSLGFSAWYPILMSILVYAGSMQFVAGNLLTQPFDPVNAFVLTLLVNARHIFYGLAMLDKYRNLGAKKLYLMFALCDETFSINVGIEPPPDVDRGLFYTLVSVLNQTYWVVGTALGALFGSFLQLETKGIVFMMTALFVVIFVNRWLQDTEHLPALCGLGISLLSLCIFGADNFIVMAMLGIAIVLLLLRPYLERRANDVLS